MRIAYFDCFSGISGDMTIAAFLDAGLSFNVLSRELAKLKLKGYRLKRSKVARGKIAGTKFDCMTDSRPHGHRSLKSIISLIDGSPLNGKVKETAKSIFNTIAAAEMKAHGKAGYKDIIFHELGDIDSIVDIVGTAIALDELDIGAVYSSKVSMGRTIVASRHGNIPVPSPAALEILKGVPVSISETEAELVTPTGAGILKTVSKGFGALPQVYLSAIGYGAGSKEIEGRPNLLRVLIGETSPAGGGAKGPFKEDSVYMIETNIDDMNPQHAGYVIEKLLSSGALDAYITNIQMKKSRPALKLTAIADAAKIQGVAAAIFGETPAIGLRFYEVNRMKLERKSAMVKTAYGDVRVKVSSAPGGFLTVSPEHDECGRLARKKNIPLRKVYEAAKLAASRVPLFIFLLFALCAMPYAQSCADTIMKSDGDELKGIVVEDYNDRITFSTASGEKTIMKADIKELYYDQGDENLVKLAQQAKDRHDYMKALGYYDMALKANPRSKSAKDGLVFLEGYLFRKEQADKEAEIKKHEEFEYRGPTIQSERAKEEDAAEKAARLKSATGMALVIKDGFPQVENVQPNSPASDAGIEKGDRLVAIWAKLTGYMELNEVLNELLDKPSLELKCVVERTIGIPIAPYRLLAPGPNELIGASFAMEFDGLTAASVREDGAANAAGLKKGDLITAIDGKSTRYMPLKKAVDMIRNSKNKMIKLTVKRDALIWRRD